MIRGFSVEQIVGSFDNDRIDLVIGGARREGYYDYHAAFERAAKNLGNAEGVLCSVLGDVCSMMFTGDQKCYGAYIRLGDGRRSASIEDFVGELAQILLGVFEKINNSFLKARVADVLWLNRKITKFQRPIRFAIAALEAYCLREVDHDSWYAGRSESLWFRAISLAMGLGKRGEPYVRRLGDKLLLAFRACSAEGNGLLIPLARLLLESKMPLSNPTEIPIKLERHIAGLKDVVDVFEQNDFYDLLLRWYELLGCKDRIEECLIRKADINCIAGGQWAKDKADPGMVSGRYEEALRCYDRLSRDAKRRLCVADKIAATRKSLRTAYRGMSENMQPIHGKRIDITAYVKSIRAEMQALNFSDALCKFVGLHRACVKDLKANTKKLLEENPTLAFFSWETLEDDRVVSRTEGIKPGEDKIEDSPRFHQMLVQQQYAFLLELEWKAQLWPAFSLLRDKRKFDESLCFDMVSQSKFVPPNRRFMFARGIKAGFDNDFQTAAALLLPQLENAVRVHLKKYDCDTMHRDVGKETDSELGLSRLVGRPELSLLLDEDLQFEMLALFGPPPNFNLRNRYAHGLVDDCAGCNMLDFYVWYMALRLVIFGCMERPERMGLKLVNRGGLHEKEDVG